MHLRTEKVKDLISKVHQYYRQKMIQFSDNILTVKIIDEFIYPRSG